MRKKRVFLENGVNFTFVWRDGGNFFAIEQHLPLVLGQEAAQDTQEGSFAAAAGAEECDELVFIDIKVDAFQHELTVKLLYDIFELYQFFLHNYLLENFEGFALKLPQAL